MTVVATEGVAGILDDPARLAAVDASGMLGHVAGLGRQLVLGHAGAASLTGLPEAGDVRALVVCGMGGSGIAGDLLRSYSARVCRVPIVVSKGYRIPAACGPGTLVVALSFSGNTAESLSAVEEARAQGCAVVTVSAGGALAQVAAAAGLPHVGLPADVPMPRAALGYLAGAAIGIAEAARLVPPSMGEEVAATAEFLDRLARDLGVDRSAADNEAKQLASWIGDRIPLVWGSEGIGEAAALRWKNQFNENAKVPAFCSTLPELDHNEIEGWSAGTGERFALIVLRHDDEIEGVARRVGPTLDAVAPSGLTASEVRARGVSTMDMLFSLVMIGDFVSTYLAILRGVDPTPVPVLSRLKDRLHG